MVIVRGFISSTNTKLFFRVLSLSSSLIIFLLWIFLSSLYFLHVLLFYYIFRLFFNFLFSSCSSNVILIGWFSSLLFLLPLRRIVQFPLILYPLLPLFPRLLLLPTNFPIIIIHFLYYSLPLSPYHHPPPIPTSPSLPPFPSSCFTLFTFFFLLSMLLFVVFPIPLSLSPLLLSISPSPLPPTLLFTFIFPFFNHSLLPSYPPPLPVRSEEPKPDQPKWP